MSVPVVTTGGRFNSAICLLRHEGHTPRLVEESGAGPDGYDVPERGTAGSGAVLL